MRCASVAGHPIRRRRTWRLDAATPPRQRSCPTRRHRRPQQLLDPLAPRALEALGRRPDLDRLRRTVQVPRERPERINSRRLSSPIPGDHQDTMYSAGIFVLTLSWNEFVDARAFIQAAETKTVPVAVLTQLVQRDVYHWGSLMAGALLGSISVALIYSFSIEHYMSSLTGAVKE